MSPKIVEDAQIFFRQEVFPSWDAGVSAADVVSSNELECSEYLRIAV